MEETFHLLSFTIISSDLPYGLPILHPCLPLPRVILLHIYQRWYFLYPKSQQFGLQLKNQAIQIYARGKGHLMRPVKFALLLGHRPPDIGCLKVFWSQYLICYNFERKSILLAKPSILACHTISEKYAWNNLKYFGTLLVYHVRRQNFAGNNACETEICVIQDNSGCFENQFCRAPPMCPGLYRGYKLECKAK